MEEACDMAQFYRERIKTIRDEYNKIDKLHVKCQKFGDKNCDVLKEDMVVLSKQMNWCRQRRDEKENKCQIYKDLTKRYQ